MAIFLLVGDDVGQYFVEQSGKLLRALPSFGRIFSEVFEDGPQIDQGSPVYVAEVGHQEVRLEVVEKLVVTCEKEVQQACAILVLDDFSLRCVIKDLQVSREAIPAIDVCGRASVRFLPRARVHAFDWCALVLVKGVALAVLDESHQHTLQRLQVWRVRGESVLKQSFAIDSLRPPEIFVLLVLDDELIQGLTRSVLGGMTFGFETAEVLSLIHI